MEALLALAVILGGVWFLLGIVCTMRIIKAMAGDNMQTLVLILILTHMVGMGFLFAGGLIWAAWLMASFPFKRAPRIPPVETPCPSCHTAMKPVTCMTCGPNRVPDAPPLAWA